MKLLASNVVLLFLERFDKSIEKSLEVILDAEHNGRTLEKLANQAMLFCDGASSESATLVPEAVSQFIK